MYQILQNAFAAFGAIMLICIVAGFIMAVLFADKTDRKIMGDKKHDLYR